MNIKNILGMIWNYVVDIVHYPCIKSSVDDLNSKVNNLEKDLGYTRDSVTELVTQIDARIDRIEAAIDGLG